MNIFFPKPVRYGGADYPYGWVDVTQTIADTLIAAGLATIGVGGTAGPAGSPGAPGVTGPTGPTGPNGNEIIKVKAIYATNGDVISGNGTIVESYLGPNGAIDSKSLTESITNKTYKYTYTYTGNNVTNESGWVLQ